MNNKCKRMTVVAIGISIDGEIGKARNSNQHECSNVPGACGCAHAEINLLEQMEDNSPKMVIVSHSPCLNCAKRLVEEGVLTVMYHEEYRITDGIDYLKENGVKVSKLFGLPEDE
ncbi:hypothetical protein [Bacillus paranthracis]|uniref:hypothetical protein n=1 Tax=Bacillus paranthracis TaxID=2026186 RepID=UPI0022E3C44E|nr:hypothetical protein [Bacillus paranthracis]